MNFEKGAAMVEARVWDGGRPVVDRVVVDRRTVRAAELSLVVATENVVRPTDWCFEESHHTIVVHLAGQLKRMESVFAAGPSTDALPAVGDIWAIPAGCRYAALAQGEHVHFAEFSVPVELLGGGDLAARVGHRDPFLHQASVRAAALAMRDDDLATMALQSLLETLRYHLADVYLGKAAGAEPSQGGGRRFSERQRRRLIDYLAASMHQPLTTQDMATTLGLSTSHLVQGFKASFGTTPWQYMLRMRLAEARRLLETSDAPVTAIAVAVGFATPSHFATSFGRHFGVTPAAYRRAQRGKAALEA